MANVKISALTALNTVDTTTQFAIISNTTGTNTTYRTSIANVTTAVLSNGNSNIRIGTNSNIGFSAIGNSNVVVISGAGANITGTGNFSGNLTAANLIGTLASGNSNIAITANGNITLTARSNSTMVVSGTGANITGTMNVSGNSFVNGNLLANTLAYVGPSTSANATRFPNALMVVSSTAVGIQQNEPHNIGLMAEGVANSANASVYGVGVYGSGYTNGGTRSGGVIGEGHVSASTDSGSAIGIRGYATDTHSGGLNIGLYGEASGSGTGNYALAMQAGGILSVAAQSWTVVDNNTAALSIDSTGKTGILKIITTDAAEGVTFSGYANVTGTVTTAATYLGGNGSAGTPTYGFTADGAQDTGFYWVSDGNIGITNNGVQTGIFRPNGVVQQTVTTIPALPAATTAGMRAYVSDSNKVASGNFGAAVVTGGSNTVPVYSDGTSWKIG
jgi:fibronectin-binding autotransporter adhesin